MVEECYRQHVDAVLETAGRWLPRDDAETVAHEVFYALLSDSKIRENFQGGHFAAWLQRVARNRAIDHLRRWRRELPELPDDALLDDISSGERMQEELEAKSLVDHFRRDCLPARWAPVFDARFVRQLTQREAAAVLGIHRTTLIYQEHRIRSILSKFLLHAGEP
ncbi:MAG: sigma-70 family RNA polymerase sigma factor [Polyangiaceae bacterium]|nr:sigma-70 family RNA polymerase sigma factor [Polyangiaceae bacterium]